MQQWIQKNGAYLILILSLLAMGGSLFFSEIMKLPPCVLCWYQRICVYPIVVLSIVGIVRRDRNAVSYILPLSIIGFIISIYHNLLYWKILPESIAPCVQGISCTTKYFEWFGFVTIPFLSMIGFLGIIIVAFLINKHNKTI